MTEWIISSAVLILVVTLVRQALKGKISLRLQYALWAIVLVRLLVPVSFGQTSFSVLNVVPERNAVVWPAGPEAPGLEDPVSTPVGGEGWTATPVVIPSADPAVSDGPVLEPDPGTAIDPVASPEPPVEEIPEEPAVISAAQVLNILWVAGMAVVALWFLISNLGFWLRLRRSRQLLEADSPIRVYVTGAVETPCLFGLIRPAVYVTPEVAPSRDVMRHVLAHELTHHRHWDHIWAVLRCVCLAVHWYDPLVWLAASLSRRDAELACDEGAIRRIGEEERAAYGRTLIGLTCAHRGNLLHTATTMTGSRKSIRERIILIAQKPKMAVYTLIAVILIAAAAVGCTFTGAEKISLIRQLEKLEEESVDWVILQLDSECYYASEDEYGEVLEVLRNITEEQCLEKVEWPGGVDYALTVHAGSESWYFRIASHEEYGEGVIGWYPDHDEDHTKAYWLWIDSPELRQYIIDTFNREKAEVEPEIPDDQPELTPEIEQMLKQAYAESIDDPGRTAAAEDVWIEQYYGKYGNSYATLIHYNDHVYLQAVWTEVVDGVEFTYPDSRRIRVYTGSGFCTLTEAFEQGLLTRSELEQIAQLHRNRKNGSEGTATALAVDPEQIMVQAKTPYQAAEAYVEAFGGAHLAQIPNFIQDYNLMNWGVDEISADGKAVAGWLECRLIPGGEYSSEGGIKFAERNGGWFYGSLSFVLEQRGEYWCVADWGALDERGALDEVTLEGSGYTPLGDIENTVIGFLNEYISELHRYTNSNWLSYTTGSIHLYSVDELSQAEQAIVWAADRNISYLEDKATYWKLGRRYYETYVTDFSISYSDMEVSQNGNRATVNVDAFESFLYEGETDRSVRQSQYEIELAKIGGVWLITDVTQNVFWFDGTYKNDREALDREIEYWESFSTSKIQQYDLNGDGVIQSVEFPYAEGEAFGLTGEYAVLYSAVAEYVMRWSSYMLMDDSLILPGIKVYGKYEDEEGNMNYVCGMNTLYVYGLGKTPGQWDDSDTGGGGGFVLATIDGDGYLVGFKTAPNGMDDDAWEQMYREYCGPLEDLAEAFINNTARTPLLEIQDADTRLAQYLNYYFGE